MQGTSVRAARLAGLNGLTATGAILETPTLILVAAAFTPNVNLLMADLTEATFTGYAAAAAVVMNPAAVNAGGQFVLSGQSQHFEATGSTTPNDIFGWALVNAAKTAVYASGAIDPVRSITQAGDGLDVLPEIVWGN